MVITVTSLRLRSLFGFFPLTLNAIAVVRQIRKQPGFLGMKNTGFGYMHYTLSSWESAEAAKAFAHSGAHRESIRKGGALAEEVRVHSYEAAAMPGWAEAKRLVAEKGRVFPYPAAPK